VERTGQVDRDDGVPALDGEILDASNMLDAGVVDQNVDAAEIGGSVGHHRLDLGWLAHVGTVEPHLDAQRGNLGARALVIAKAVEHDVRTLARQRLCNPQADAAGGAGNEGGFAFQHDVISN
jgi:hypothetical protein